MSIATPQPDWTSEQVPLSKRKQRNRVYEFIGNIARPGDIIFVISKEPRPQSLLDRLKWWLNYRSQGYPAGDWSEWGTMVFSHMAKESKGGSQVPVVYQSKEPIAQQLRIPPGYFRGESRLEILRFEDMNSEQGKIVLNYLSQRNMRPHDHSELRWNRITFLTGLPNIFIKRRLENCVRTTMEAFESAGILFSHRCNLMPIWNYARYRGRPILHTKYGVAPCYNYLQDHHLYSDTKLRNLAAVYQRDDEYVMEVNPQRFSWVSET